MARVILQGEELEELLVLHDKWLRGDQDGKQFVADSAEIFLGGDDAVGLQGVEFSNSKVYLNKAVRVKFDGSSFVNCLVTGDVLSGSMVGCRFDQCNMVNIGWTADLKGSVFTSSNFSSDSFFDECSFRGVTFRKCVVEGVFKSCVFPDAKFVDCLVGDPRFVDCDFAGAKFVGLRSRHMNIILERCEMRQCSFSKGVVGLASESCTFSSVAMDGVDVAYWSASGCELNRCDFSGVVFSNYAVFSGCAMPGISFKQVSFDSVHFNKSNMKGALFIGATFAEAGKFEDCDCRDADFTGARMKNVEVIGDTKFDGAKNPPVGSK